MTFLFFVLFVLVAWHFAYQGIVLPTLLALLRNRLFALRDRLRTMQFIGAPPCDGEAFEYVHNGINNFLNRLHLVDVGLHQRIHKMYESDADFRETVANRRRMMEAAGNEQLRNIMNEADETLKLAVAANAGGWAIYVIPVLLFVFWAKTVMDFAKDVLALPSAIIPTLLPLPEKHAPAAPAC